MSGHAFAGRRWTAGVKADAPSMVDSPSRPASARSRSARRTQEWVGGSEPSDPGPYEPRAGEGNRRANHQRLPAAA